MGVTVVPSRVLASLCKLGCFATCYVDQAALGLTESLLPLLVNAGIKDVSRHAQLLPSALTRASLSVPRLALSSLPPNAGVTGLRLGLWLRPTVLQVTNRGSEKGTGVTRGLRGQT